MAEIPSSPADVLGRVAGAAVVQHYLGKLGERFFVGRSIVRAHILRLRLVPDGSHYSART